VSRFAAARATACDHNARVTIRRLLIRVPIIGPIVERRWMPDSAERDRHRALVISRLPVPGPPAPVDPPDPGETPGP